MNTLNGRETRPSEYCTCNSPGRVHHADCGCHAAEEFLAKPTAQYLQSRRDFLRKVGVGTLTVAAMVPLAQSEAAAQLFGRPGADQQKKLGNQAAADVLKKYKEVTDSRAKSFRKVGERLVDALGDQRGPWDYTFRVVDSKEVNAFALPGGNMFMYTGLLSRIQSADELAAVTGHEMEHVRGEHWSRRVGEQQTRELGLAALLGLTRAGSTVRTLFSVGDGLLSLSYSRKDEDSADNRGLQTMARAGYDPEGMIDLFNTLAKASGGSNGGIAILSTHPLTKDRIKKAKERIAKIKAETHAPGNG